MPYASVIDLERLDGAISFTQNTVVTKPDVEAFLTQTAAQIDAVLNARDYITPVVAASAPQSYPLLTHLNTLAADSLAQSAWPDSPRAERAREDWEKALAWIRGPDFYLPDAPRDNTKAALQIGVGSSMP
jgi:hypothetical protein